MIEEDDLREMRREIEEIRDEVADINHIQGLMARADGRLPEYILNYFREGATETKVALYLAVDGRRTSSQIAKKIGVDPAQITRHAPGMVEEGILGLRQEGNKKIYYRTNIERALYLSRLLRDLAND